MPSQHRQDEHISPNPALSSAVNETKNSDREDANFLSSEPHEKSLNSRELPNLRQLSRSFFLLAPLTIYTFLMLFAWVITCKMTHRPMTAPSYGVTSGPHGDYNSGYSQKHRYSANNRWYTAVRFIQAGVTVLTLPLTTTICSYAAVVYLQHTSMTSSSQSEPNINLRQMMSLADRGWTDLTLYTKLLIRPFRNWKRYGSPFLAYAILLHILGGIISPIQQIYLSSVSVRTPTAPYFMEPKDIAYIFAGRGDNVFNSMDGGMHRNALATRKALEAVSSNEMPSGLWSGSHTTCLAPGYTVENSIWETSNATLAELCFRPGLTWSNISALPSPFMSSLPKDFNTGLIRQLAPRFNSTASYRNITAAEFPSDCVAQNGSLSFEYSNTSVVDTDYGPAIWALQACMPANSYSSISEATRDRQDFTEEMFLNVTLNKAMQDGIKQWHLDNFSNAPESEYFRVQVRTTAGYFELPNYMNGQVAGPLLGKIPIDFCGTDCLGQFTDVVSPGTTQRKKRGPLSDIMIALFGEGSYLANRAKAPDLYVTKDKSGQWTECVDLAPFGLLLPTSKESHGCINGGSAEGVGMETGKYLSSFRNNLDSIEYAFTVAAYLANGAWLDTSSEAANMLISYDLGEDFQRPSISIKGVIILSALQGIFLTLLWAATIYAILLPRWTEKLDSFTMMRLGASIHEKVPLRLAGNLENISILDETPGWIGDSTGHERLGHVALGGPAELKAKKHFDAYYRPGFEKRLRKKIAHKARMQALERERRKERVALIDAYKLRMGTSGFASSR